MAGEELQVIRLRDDFYREGFYKILFAFAIILAAIIFLIALSVYLYITKPNPVQFSTDNEWRILKSVPVNEVYLTTPDLIQWVSEIVPTLFTYDFLHYDNQLKNVQKYFTPAGWKKYLEILKQYVNPNTLQSTKQFISTSPGGAPFIVNQGLLQGRYAWWVQMPITANYITIEKSEGVGITLQVLVVRVPTLDNLYGVAIDNINVLTKANENQAQTTNATT